jgi:hypothetical protein
MNFKLATKKQDLECLEQTGKAASGPAHATEPHVSFISTASDTLPNDMQSLAKRCNHEDPCDRLHGQKA